MTECILEHRARPTLRIPNGKCGLKLSLRCFGMGTGEVSVGEIRAKILRGRAVLDLASLPDGEYPAKLETGPFSYTVALLKKQGGTVEDVTYDPLRILALTDDLLRQNERLCKAEQTLQMLVRKIGEETVLSL